MMKMLIVMDYDKIRQEKKLDIFKIERFFEHEFTKRGIYKDSDGFYVGGDFASFGGMVWGLSETQWFMDNVKTWIWYNSDGAARKRKICCNTKKFGNKK